MPTRKSETDRQNSNAKDGEWSSRVFQMMNIMVPFPSTAVSAKIELKTHDVTLAVISSGVFLPMNRSQEKTY